MQFSSAENNTDLGKAVDTLRGHETWFDWKAHPFHFELLQVHQNAYEIYGFFRDAMLMPDGRLHFNGATKRGVLGYDMARSRFSTVLHRVFGDIEVCLSKDRQVLRSFRTLAPRGAGKPALPPALTDKLYGGVMA